MNILFLNVVKNVPIQKMFYPLGFGYLKSYAEKYEEHFTTCYVEHLDFNVLKQCQPDVVAMGAVTENYNKAQQYAKTIKKFNSHIKVVIGGIHISSVPQSLNPNMDVGVVGEGEQTFLELLKNNFEPKSTINGIVFKDEDELILTQKRTLIEPLDNIPYPDRNMFGSIPRKCTYMFTSRGCPNRCVFCSSSRFWGKVRLHSAEYVAKEIAIIKDRGIKHVWLYDDTFLIDIERTRAISEIVKDYGITFVVSARANQITDDAVQILKRMNVTNVGMGLESNSAEVLEWLQKGNTPETNQRAIDILKRNNMSYSASFIKGTPIETKKDLKLTFDFIKRNKIPYDLYQLVKYPNTPIYDGSTDWDACRTRYNLPKILKMKRLFMRSRLIHKTYRKIMRRGKK